MEERTTRECRTCKYLPQRRWNVSRRQLKESPDRVTNHCASCFSYRADTEPVPSYALHGVKPPAGRGLMLQW